MKHSTFYIVIDINKHVFYISAVLSVITMGLFLVCCVLDLIWTVASTKYCEMSRTMNELMEKLRALEKIGRRKGKPLTKFGVVHRM